MYLDLSPLFAVCEYSYVLATRLKNHAACHVESRPLNCRNSVSTVQLDELTDDVLEIFLRKASTAERQPGHGASTPEACSDTVGVGEQDEGVSGRGVILVVS